MSWIISFIKINLRDYAAQRLVAQALGHLRFVVTILAGKYKPQLIILSLSLGQVARSHVLGFIKPQIW
jgi:hypothetical protein